MVAFKVSITCNFFSCIAIANALRLAGDTALLRRFDRFDQDGLLLWPLKEAKTIHRSDGLLKHDDVIGKRVRDIVATHKGNKYRIHDPTLEDYVRLTPRFCTPVRAALQTRCLERN